jgi:hypothetical protein
MARGWESKSIESQQSETLTTEERQAVSRDELERTRKRESLEMQRRRIAHDLQSARSDVHRTALENALRFLDEELGRM